MTTMALNNLWTYLQGLSLAKKDREWLAAKLLEPTAKEEEIAQQQSFVKESLYRALDEVKRAKMGESQLMTEKEFFKKLDEDGIV